jgi:hypothetical protein
MAPTSAPRRRCQCDFQVGPAPARLGRRQSNESRRHSRLGDASKEVPVVSHGRKLDDLSLPKRAPTHGLARLERGSWDEDISLFGR